MKNKKTIDPSEIKILVCCHKKCELPPNPDGIFLPIQVGAAISDVDLGIQRDDLRKAFQSPMGGDSVYK